MNPRRMLLLFALLAGAFGSWQLARLLSRPPVEAAAPGLEHRGFYLRAASILGTGENGELLYRIDAEYAEQRSETEIDLQNVRVVYTSRAEVPWTLVADEASIGSELD
ncbi:MAG: LPS export ABC transporter periplasmic protein LptC, partial [Woeseiaceae bacterium]